MHEKSLIIIPYHYSGPNGGLDGFVVSVFAREGEAPHVNPISPHGEGVSNNSLKVMSWLEAG